MGAHIDRSSSSKVTVRRAAAGTVRLAPTTGPRGPEGPASTVPGPPGGSDEAFAAWISDDGSETRVALANRFAPAKTVATLPSPFIIPHKGGGSFVVPEHTEAAYSYGLAHGFYVLDMDAQTTRDGGLVDLHNETVDAITTGTGSVANHTIATIGLLDVDAGSWFAPAWPNNMKIGLVGDRFAKYGTTVVHNVEAKAASGAEVQAIIDLAHSHAVTQSLCIQSANLVSLAPAVEAGVYTSLVTTTADPAAVAATGVNGVTVDMSTASDATMQAYRAAGLDLWVWNCNRHYDFDRAVALGATGLISDDPVYLQGHMTGNYTYRRNSDAFSLRTFDAGMLPAHNDRGKFIGTNRYGWDIAGTNSIVLLGNLCPVTATSYTLTFSITFDAVGGSGTASAGLFICGPDDRPQKYTAGNYRDGYYVNLNQAGTLAISKVDSVANTSTQLGGVPGTGAPVAGGTATIRVQVSPVDIKINRVDGSVNTVYTTTDTAFRGGYVHLGHIGLGSSLKASFSDIALV